MANIRVRLLEIGPNVRPARNGWLAASGSGSPLVVAVIAEDEQAARKAFEMEVHAWIPLFEQASRETESAL
jgi:hypothetical protein